MPKRSGIIHLFFIPSDQYQLRSFMGLVSAFVANSVPSSKSSSFDSFEPGLLLPVFL